MSEWHDYKLGVDTTTQQKTVVESKGLNVVSVCTMRVREDPFFDAIGFFRRETNEERYFVINSRREDCVTFMTCGKSYHVCSVLSEGLKKGACVSIPELSVTTATA
jgi:hypothetical protein